MTQLEAARKGIITEEMAIPKAIRIYETGGPEVMRWRTSMSASRARGRPAFGIPPSGSTTSTPTTARACTRFPCRPGWGARRRESSRRWAPASR